MKHRGIAYSVSDKGNGRWGWNLHPEEESHIVLQVISGEVYGQQADAIWAAEVAIDREMARKHDAR